MDRIAGSYCIGSVGWIGLDCIVSYWLDEDTLDFMHWLVTARMGDRVDGMFGALVVQGWDVRTLVPARTGAPEQERHHWHLRDSNALDGHC